MSEITVPDYDNLLLDKLALSAPAQVNRSAWTGRRKVIGLPGAETWTGAVTIDTISTENEERPWRAFLAALRGPDNWFKWMLPCATHLGAKPNVASGAGNGYTLPLTGMQPSTTILRAGQYMTVPLPSGHKRAVCLTADLVANGSGAGTASFAPALGETPAAGATVETLAPYIPMAPTQTTLGFDMADGLSGTSFEVEEAR